MYLIDTNIIIYHFNNSIPAESKDKVKNILSDHFNISVITKMEFLGFKKLYEESFTKARSFIEYADIIDIDNYIVEKVIDIKRNISIKLPDAIIAATAIIHGLTLVTRNIKDFNGLELERFNPFQQ